MEKIRQHLEEASSVLDKFLTDDENLRAIEHGAELLYTALGDGQKVLSCGNGGSMSDSMHFAEELVGKFREERPAIPAIALGADPAFTSCTSNDFGYDEVFARGVEAYGRAGDVLLAFSTSGNSGNVIKAIHKAREASMSVIGLTGKDGGKMAGLCDAEIRVPHHGYADRIQEVHIKVVHIFINLTEHHLGYV
jgi:D-sedoheptulose 7-phosphate isomerase